MHGTHVATWRWLAAITVAAVTVTGLPVAAAADPLVAIPQEQVSPSAEVPDGTPPTGFDAQQSELVAVDEFTQTYANADGSFTDRVSLEPINVQDESGDWVEVSDVLEPDGAGGAVVVDHPLGPQLASSADATDLLTVERGGLALSFQLVGAAPARGVRTDESMTYRDVFPGIDLVYDVTNGAVKDNLVLAEVPDGPVSWSWHMTADGAQIVPDEHGLSWNILDAQGQTQMRMPPVVVVDSSGQEGVSENAMINAPMSVTQDATGWTLTVTPDVEWLRDPDRVYPVTVDPWVALPNNNIWSYKSDGTVMHDDYARIGNTHEKVGDRYWRTVLHYDYENYIGKIIRDVSVYEGLASGTANAYRSAITWANAFSYGGIGDSEYAAGYVGTEGRLTGSTLVTKLAAWASSNTRGAYMILTGQESSNLYTYKALQTWMDITYDSYPDRPTGLSVAPSSTTASKVWTNTTTPTLSGTVSDSDWYSPDVDTGNDYVLDANIVVLENGTRIWGVGVTTPSGSVGAAQVSPGTLRDGQSYTLQVRGSDYIVEGVEATLDFGVDTTKPESPVVVSNDYPTAPRGSKGPNETGWFGLSMKNPDASVTGYQWALDAEPSPSVVAGVIEGAAISVPVTPLTAGPHTLKVRAVDRAGNVSPTATEYAFRVGEVGITAPKEGTRVVRRTRLFVYSSASSSTLSFEWRRPDSTTVSAVPPAYLSTSSGAAWTSLWSPNPTGANGYTVLDAGALVGFTGGPLQVRARVRTAGGVELLPGQWVTINVDPDADASATAEIGPGAVNLLTGDYTVSATDVNEFGVSLGRTISSRAPAAGYQAQQEMLTAAQQKANDASAFPAGSATSSVSTTVVHSGSGESSSVVVTPNGASTDSFVAVGADSGGLRLGMQAGHTYRVSAWVYVPSATGSLPTMSGCQLRLAVFWKQAGGYSSPCTDAGAQARPTFANAWQQVKVDMTVPADATEAFVRLYNGYSAAGGQTVYWDDLSLRELWAPMGAQWSFGTADDGSGAAYTQISQPSADVASLALSGGGDIWFSTADQGVTWSPESGAQDLSLTRDGAADTWTLRDIAGSVTTFTRASAAAVWTVASTSDGVADHTTRYVYQQVNGVSRLSRMIAPVEAGVDGWPTNATACTQATPVVGCEVIELEYATATSATAAAPGTFVGRVTAAWAWAYDPAKSGGASMNKVAVARYEYDQMGRLVGAWDPRVAPALKTMYSYDTLNRLVSLTTPGEPAYVFGYSFGSDATISGSGDLIDNSRGRLLTVQRDSLKSSTNTTSVVYAVPLTTTGGGPYDLSATALARWAQNDGPTDATAVFPPQSVPAVATATPTAPTSAQYAKATVHYLNGSGLEVNTASPAGANPPSAGYIDTAEYDQHGNVIRTLDATNRLVALGQLAGSDLVAAWGLPAMPSAQAAQLLDTQTTYSADGLDVVQTLGPIQKLAVGNDATTTRVLRPRVRNLYDENKPGGAAYHVLTTTVSDGWDYTAAAWVPGQSLGVSVGYDQLVTTYGYDAIDGAASTAPSSGWVHRQPTSVTAAPGTAQQTVATVLYDTWARPIRSSKKNADGTDTTTVSTFYTAVANAAVPACGNAPQWAGQPCQTATAGAVTGLAAATIASSTLPVKTVSGYNMWGSPTVVSETSTGPVNGSSAASTLTRTTTTSYDAADRVTGVAISGSAAAAGASIAKTTTSYDTTSGEVSAVRTVDAVGAVVSSVTKTYDALGRVTSYTDATGATTTSTYDRYGNPASMTQTIAGKTLTTTYAYDDPRGYLTSVVDPVAGSTSAVWGPDGQLVSQSLPGGVTLAISYDPARVPIGRTYTTTAGTVLFSDSVVENHKGQWLQHTSTTATMTYGYDVLGRLTRVTDAAGNSCTLRTYGYDVHSNRVSIGTATATTGNPCPTAATTTAASTYDSADRLMSGGGGAVGAWLYDPFGRTTTMPSLDGAVQNTYYLNDLVAAQTISGVARYSWTLDPVQRRSVNTQQAWVSGAWANSVTKTAHYGDDSDEPTWIGEDVTLPSAVTRYVEGVDGDLAVTTSSTGSRVLQLLDLHGDVAATVPLADGAGAVDASGRVLNRTDEFGNPEPLAGAATANAPNRYGWLGGAQRSSESLGDLVLMGVRLYAPATGRFLTPDPVPGGSASGYDYCNADPVNCTDLGGTIEASKV